MTIYRAQVHGLTVEVHQSPIGSLAIEQVYLGHFRMYQAGELRFPRLAYRLDRQGD